MILEGICYPVIQFGRVILSRLRIQSFLGEYLVVFMSTFVLRRLLTSPVSPLMSPLMLCFN